MRSIKSTTSLELSTVDKNYLTSIREKTGAISNAEVLRNLIREKYVQLSKTKLSKSIKEGQPYIFKGVK